MFWTSSREANLTKVPPFERFIPNLVGWLFFNFLHNIFFLAPTRQSGPMAWYFWWKVTYFDEKQAKFPHNAKTIHFCETRPAVLERGQNFGLDMHFKCIFTQHIFLKSWKYKIFHILYILYIIKYSKNTENHFSCEEING